MNDQRWKLREAPAAGIVPGSATYQGAIHDEALARLLFIIEQRRPCGLLFGPPGSGKTLLLEQLGQIVRRSARDLALVDVHGRDSRETLWELCGELGINPRHADSSFTLWRRLQDHLLAGGGSLLPAIVILDHADQGVDDANVLVSRLAHLAQQRRGLTLILAVRARSLADLPESLRDASDLRIELGWLDLQQTLDFVSVAFQHAEEHIPSFDAAAIGQMHALTEGSPRLLIQLGDLALLTALANDELTVNVQTVLTAATDLQIMGSTSHRPPVVSTSRHFYD